MLFQPIVRESVVFYLHLLICQQYLPYFCFQRKIPVKLKKWNCRTFEMEEIFFFFFFFNEVLFLFSSNLQTILNSKKKKKRTKNKQTKSYYKDNRHINISTVVLLVKPPSHPVAFSFSSKIVFMVEIIIIMIIIDS